MTRHATDGLSFEELAQLKVKRLGTIPLKGGAVGAWSVQPGQQPVPVHSALVGVTIPLWDPGWTRARPNRQLGVKRTLHYY